MDDLLIIVDDHALATWGGTTPKATANHSKV
jgi:hypothetical protein